MTRFATTGKEVTDAQVLSAIAKTNTDWQEWEFSRDYGVREKPGFSPYCKNYLHLNGGTQIMASQGLPMVNADDSPIDPRWVENKGKIVTMSANLVTVTIDKRAVEMLVRNDQPTGIKAGARLGYEPRLFVGGKEIQPKGSPSILAMDPRNADYLNNTLEWDYGICKRRLRMVQGRLHGYWLFPADPGGDVLIRYQQSGDLRLRLGDWKQTDDEESIPAAWWKQPNHFGLALAYPLEISDSLTFYPDPHVETSSVDGWIEESTASETWATKHDNTTGTGVYDAVDYFYNVLKSYYPTPLWNYITRGMFLFDTSSLGVLAVVSAATLSLYGYSKAAGGGWGTTYQLYSSAPASNVALATSDYNKASFGGTAFSSAIAYASWSTTGYNAFALNAAGIANISITGVSKFGLREATYDFADSAPVWKDFKEDNIFGYTAEKGTTYRPKLVVTYQPTKALTDGLTLTDALANAIKPVKADTLTLTDARVVTLGKAAADGITLTDAFARVWMIVRAYSDGLSLADALANQVAIPQADALTLTDALANTPKPVFADTLSLADALTILEAMARADTLTLTDSLANAYGLARSDGLTLTDALTQFVAQALADGITLSDALTSLYGMARADGLTLTDANGNAVGKPLADSLTLTDALAVGLLYVLADTLTLVDAIANAVAKPLPDGITLTDVLTQNVAQVLADVISLSDALAKATEQAQADTITLTDALVKDVGQPHGDGLTLTDAIGNAPGKALGDSINLADALVKAVGLAKADGITLADAITKYVQQALGDSLGLGDALANAVAHPEADGLTLTDAIVNHPNKGLTDSLTLTDAQTKAISILRTDILTLTDALTKYLSWTLTDGITLSDAISLAMVGVGMIRAISQRLRLISDINTLNSTKRRLE